MFKSVYNAYAMSMFLFASIIRSTVSPEEKHLRTDAYFRDSGFFLINKESGLSTGFNVKGHNRSGLYVFDSRLTALTPLFLKFNDTDVLPGIPYSQKPISIPRKTSLIQKVSKRITELGAEYRENRFLKTNNPLHAGFLPFLHRRNKLFIPMVNHSDSITRDSGGIAVIKAQGEFIEVSQSGILPVMHMVMNTLRHRFTGNSADSTELTMKPSGYSFERNVFIHDRFIHFIDRFGPIGSLKAGFTVRAYGQWSFDDLGNTVVFQNSGHGFTLVSTGRVIQKREKSLCSSKGEVRYVELIYDDADNGNRRELAHTLIPFDGKYRDNDIVNIQEIASTYHVEHQ